MANPSHPAKIPTSEAARGFGHALRNARHDAGLTQAHIARRIGITVAYISRIEQGLENPTLSSCEEFVRAVGLDLRFTVTKETVIAAIVKKA